MNFWLYEKFDIETCLSFERINDRLNHVVEEDQLYFIYSPYTKPFHGSVELRDFKIKPTINGRNSFIPLIIGKTEESNSTTIIHIVMRPCISVLFFLTAWFIFCMKFFILSFSEQVSYIPLGMIMFLYVLSYCGFKYESVKAKKYIIDLLKSN